MINIAICDDNKMDLGNTAEMIQEWVSNKTNAEFSIKCFLSPYTLLKAIAKGNSFDIFILDILMPEMNGIILSEQLHSLTTDPLLIYLTSSKDYYPDAFRLYAFQYICKPIQKNNLFTVLDKAYLRLDKQKRSVFSLKTPDGIVQVPLNTIVYAELLDHICHVHLADGQTLQSQYLRTGFDTFSHPLLQHLRFIKTHTAFIVNLSFASKLTAMSLSLTTGATIPVSRTFFKELRRCYIEYGLRDAGE